MQGISSNGIFQNIPIKEGLVTVEHIIDSGQDCSNSSALAMELLQSSSEPSISQCKVQIDMIIDKVLIFYSKYNKIILFHIAVMVADSTHFFFVFFSQKSTVDSSTSSSSKVSCIINSYMYHAELF